MTTARTTLPNEERKVDPEAAARVAKIISSDEVTLREIVEAEKPTRKRKTRSDKDKPRAVKQAAPTSDPAKRKHLALVEKYYALLDKRDALDASLEQVRAEINAQLTQ